MKNVLNDGLPFEDVKTLVTTCILNKEPIMVWGPPGIGKSDMVFEIGRELNREVVDIRLCLYENVDIKGYPFLKDVDGEKRLSFAHSEELPSDPDSDVIIFLDEINAADPSTQKACYQLILNRRIGDYVLPDKVTIVAAGNRQQDKGGIFSMPKPLENRFVHVEMRPSPKDWLDWAVGAMVQPEVVGFISKFESKLFDFDTSNDQRAFATPRSWTKAAKLLAGSPGLSDKHMKLLVGGCIGSGLAVEFMAFRAVVNKLPEPMKIFTKKVSKVDKDLERSLCYSLVITCLYKLRTIHQDSNEPEEQKKTSEYLNNFFEYLLDNDDVIGAELVAMAISMAFKTYKLPINKDMPGIKNALTKYGKIINKAL